MIRYPINKLRIKRCKTGCPAIPAVLRSEIATLQKRIKDGRFKGQHLQVRIIALKEIAELINEITMLEVEHNNQWE